MKPISFLYAHRKILISINLIIIGLTVPGLKKAVQPSNEIKIWFSPDDPALIDYQNFNDTFGNDRVTIACTCDEHGIFKKEVLEEIRDVTVDLQKIDGVKKVTSFLNAKDIIKIRENSRTAIKYTSYFSGSIPTTTLGIDSLRNEILRSETMVHRFINEDTTCYNLIISLAPFDDIDTRRDSIFNAIETAIHKHIKTGDTYLGGLDVVTLGLNQITKQQFFFFLALSYAFLILLIVFLFRRPIYLIYSLLTTLSSVLITLGIYGHAGFKLNIFTIIIPPFIIVLGIILIAYILNSIETSEPEKEADTPEIKHLKALIYVFKPCLFASLTTMIGLISLLTSSTLVLKSFGLFSALGIALMFIEAFLFALFLLPFIKDSTRQPTVFIDWHKLLAVWAAFLKKIRYLFITATVILLIISARGFYLMKVDMWPLKYFPEDHQVYSDHLAIESRWGNYLPLDLVLEVDTTHSMYDRGLLIALDNFFNELSEVEELSTSISYHHLLKRATRQLFNRDLKIVLQDPLLSNPFINSLKRLDLEENEYLKTNINKARITLIGPSLTTSQIAEALDLIERTARSTLPSFAQISAAGYPVLFLRIMDKAINSMKRSLIFALTLIFLLMLALFKSVKKAIIALIPNIFTILLLFAFLGYTGINLDLATVTLAAIVLGVSIDDTIHFMYHFEYHARKELPVWDKITSTLIKTGKIILITSLIIMCGFSTMLFAELKTVFYFGLLMVFSGFIAIIGDLTLLPILIALSNRKDPFSR